MSGGVDIIALKAISDKTFEDHEATESEESEILCGLWGWHPEWIQIFTSKKAYVLIFGLTGMVQFATGSYFVATISTLEKRFKIPSRTSGFMTGSLDFGTLFASMFMAYVGGKGHKTRWVALGSFIVSVSCYIRLIPHILFGAGDDVIYSVSQSNISKTFLSRGSLSLCGPGALHEEVCSVNEVSFYSSIIMVGAQILMGIGTSVYWTLGVAYLDDNVRKNKMPWLLSISSFLRMFGPTLGFLLASYSLKLYVEPSKVPPVTSDDRRWIGAWWYGWIHLGTVNVVFALTMALFPRTLPRAAKRIKDGDCVSNSIGKSSERSVKDFVKTMQRLFKNPVLMYNTLSTVCYIFGVVGYWTFMPKYLETQFRKSSSESSLISGAVGLVFTAMGVIISGAVISKTKPRPRILAAWNVFVEMLEVLGHFSYAFIGCPAEDLHGSWNADGSWNLQAQCNAKCNCGPSVKYEPVCALDKSLTFYSPCHAGCTGSTVVNSTKVFTNCSCISQSGMATESFCEVDCSSNFNMFIILLCTLRFFSSTGRAGNAVIQYRSVSAKDKAVSIGLTEVLLSAFAFIPGPIVYGALLDSACLVWGNTCVRSGNCWLYYGQTLRYYLNFTASDYVPFLFVINGGDKFTKNGETVSPKVVVLTKRKGTLTAVQSFMLLATVIDCGVWYHVKDLKIYDEDKSKELPLNEYKYEHGPPIDNKFGKTNQLN